MEKEYVDAEVPLVISVSARRRQEDQAFKITLVGGQTKGHTQRGVGSAQQIKHLLYKPGDLSSSPRTPRKVEGENWLRKVVL